MTRKEAIDIFKNMLREDQKILAGGKLREALVMGLKSLELDEKYCMLEDEDFHAKWHYTNAVMDPWKCSNCGFEASDEFDYCPRCGRDMRDIDEEG